MPTKKTTSPKVAPKKPSPRKPATKKPAIKKEAPQAETAVAASIVQVEPAAATTPVELPAPSPEPLPEPMPALETSPVPATPVPPVVYVPVQPLSSSDERTWGLLAHLSVLLNLVTGFAGPIAAFIIYLIYKDRSRYVAYHALQSVIFQMIWWFGGGVLIGMMWAIVVALSALLVGVILIPFALLATFVLALLPLGALIYGCVGAVQVSQGQDFKYWLVGDWVRGTLTG